MLEFTERVLSPNALFALGYVHDARFSPDGKHIAYVTSRTDEESSQEFFELSILDLASNVHRVLELSGRATFPRWSPDGASLAFIGSVGESQRLYVCSPSGEGVRALTTDECQVQGPIDWSPDGETLAFTAITQRVFDGVRRITRRVYRAEELGLVDAIQMSIRLVDVSSGDLRTLAAGCNVAMQPSFSPCGKRILFLGSEAAVADQALVGGLKLLTIDLADGHRVEILGERWFIAAAAWSPCGEKIVFAGAYDSSLIVPKSDLWVVNRDGSDARCRTPNLIGNIGFRIHHDMPTWGTSQDSMLCVPDTRHAYATVLNGGCTEICRITLDGETRCEPVASGLRSCLIMDVNAKVSRMLYCVSDLNTPWDLYSSDLDGQDEKRHTQLNAAVLAKWPALRVEHLKFESNDERSLEGWCVRRADRDGPQPTVLFIHGGPMLAVGHAFRFDFHLLAANGYSVVFSNFRGSSGYGEAFMRALVGDWGCRGFPDHMAAVDSAIQHGLADPNRLGVWGPSHGGFASCWIVTHSQRFRAAVAEASCTNFSTMYYLSDAPDLWCKDLGGRPDQIPDVYRSRSPLTYARSCRTPTLMLHGEDDLRCPVAEAEQFYRALHDAGCVTELVKIPGATHMGDSIGPLPARKAQNEALLEWFERHL